MKILKEKNNWTRMCNVSISGHEVTVVCSPALTVLVHGQVTIVFVVSVCNRQRRPIMCSWT